MASLPTLVVLVLLSLEEGVSHPSQNADETAQSAASHYFILSSPSLTCHFTSPSMSRSHSFSAAGRSRRAVALKKTIKGIGITHHEELPTEVPTVLTLAIAARRPAPHPHRDSGPPARTASAPTRGGHLPLVIFAGVACGKTMT